MALRVTWNRRELRRIRSSGHQRRDVAGLHRQCLHTPGLRLIDYPVDYSDNGRILNEEIKAFSEAP